MAQRSRVGYEFAQPPAAVPHKRRAPYRDPLMPPPMYVSRRGAAFRTAHDRSCGRARTYMRMHVLYLYDCCC